MAVADVLLRIVVQRQPAGVRIAREREWAAELYAIRSELGIRWWSRAVGQFSFAASLTGSSAPGRSDDNRGSGGPMTNRPQWWVGAGATALGLFIWAVTLAVITPTLGAYAVPDGLLPPHADAAPVGEPALATPDPTP
jgi:hypothetical protein